MRRVYILENSGTYTILYSGFCPWFRDIFLQAFNINAVLPYVMVRKNDIFIGNGYVLMHIIFTYIILLGTPLDRLRKPEWTF
jgi:hypothetical protein